MNQAISRAFVYNQITLFFHLTLSVSLLFLHQPDSFFFTHFVTLFREVTFLDRLLKINLCRPLVTLYSLSPRETFGIIPEYIIIDQL